jgi:hypothetical protein
MEVHLDIISGNLSSVFISTQLGRLIYHTLFVAAKVSQRIAKAQWRVGLTGEIDVRNVSLPRVAVENIGAVQQALGASPD